MDPKIYKRTVELDVFGEWFMLEVEVEDRYNEEHKLYEFYLLRSWGLDPECHPVTKDFIKPELLGRTRLAHEFEKQLYAKIKTWIFNYYDSGD